MKKYIAALVSILALATSCDDFLSKENPNAIESEYFFKDENSLVIYTNSLTRSWVPEIIDFVNGDRYTDTHGWDGKYNFYTDNYDVDDMTSWSWSFLRSVNYFLEHMGEADVEKDIARINNAFQLKMKIVLIQCEYGIYDEEGDLLIGFRTTIPWQIKKIYDEVCDEIDRLEADGCIID